MMMLTFVVAAWLLIGAILSSTSGWKQLAGQFPLPAVPAIEGRPFRFVSGTVGSPAFPIRYRTCLACSVSSAGLALSVLPLLRFMHPPMFIPWSAVERATRDALWLATVTTLGLRGFSLQLRLAGEAGISAFEAYEGYRSSHT
jgi:hypothetical protein